MVITFAGSGAIATSLGNILADRKDLDVTLLSIEEEVVDSINRHHINQRYFPNIPLKSELRATEDKSILKNTDVLFLAVPSSITVEYVRENYQLFKSSAILVNLAKGFGENNRTIAESIATFTSHCVSSLKGPTFARDIINNQPTGFTVACSDESVFQVFSKIFLGTNIYLDFSKDVRGVEILSILKNIYAIAMGIADAHYDSPNLRFLFLTKAFREMRDILGFCGGREETMFHYCGYGDFSLTALNDLSRNRTLGLLIGKGFFVKDISDKVTLEGKIAVKIFCDDILGKDSSSRYPIIHELYKVFNEDYDVSGFTNRILNS